MVYCLDFKCLMIMLCLHFPQLGFVFFQFNSVFVLFTMAERLDIFEALLDLADGDEKNDHILEDGMLFFGCKTTFQHDCPSCSVN